MLSKGHDVTEIVDTLDLSEADVLEVKNNSNGQAEV